MGVPRPITKASSLIHWITVVVLPLTFIFSYCSVLMRALVRFWTEQSSGIDIFGQKVELSLDKKLIIFGQKVELWYFVTLVFFNTLTLSFYAFAFFPCRVFTISPKRMAKLIEERATELWEMAEKPEGKFDEIKLLAGRQIRLRYGLR